jgi:recombination protein RecT
MTQTEALKQELAKKKPMQDIRAMVEASAAELGKALPVHMRPERIVRIALTTLRMNPKLYQCNPQSFLGALFQCAQLGLEPNIEGQAYIIPYNVKGDLMAQFQLGYKGLVELFWRHQQATSLQMEKVYENDEFNYDLGENTISHRPALKERGEVTQYYAIARLGTHGKIFKVMSKDDAMKFATRFSKCYDRKTGQFYAETPWKDHFDAMAQKTILIQLMKILPKSIEIQRALSMDSTIKTKIAPDMFEVAQEVEHEELDTDAEVVPDGGGLSPEEKKAIVATEKAQQKTREPGED